MHLLRPTVGVFIRKKPATGSKQDPPKTDFLRPGQHLNSSKQHVAQIDAKPEGEQGFSANSELLFVN